MPERPEVKQTAKPGIWPYMQGEANPLISARVCIFEPAWLINLKDHFAG